MSDLHPDTHRQQQALQWACGLSIGARPTPDAPPGTQAIVPPVLPEGWVYHLLYCSQARHPFADEQLADLLEQTRRYNEQHGITGLLCYGGSHFVQILEGTAEEVEQLFGHIARDRRHHQLCVLSRGMGPARRFADWRMAFAKAHTQEFYWLITHLEARHNQLLLRQIPIPEPRLLGHLDDFCHTCHNTPQPR